MIVNFDAGNGRKSSSGSDASRMGGLLASGLGEFTLRELLGLLISSVALVERNLHLERHADDKPNGFYERSLHVGGVAVEIQVPRTRQGTFRPTSLPPRYQRGYDEEVQSALLALLVSAGSVDAARIALGKMGLAHSVEDLNRLAIGLVEELEYQNNRPVDHDLLAVFLEGKQVEVPDADGSRTACIYLAIGLDHDGKKRILACRGQRHPENISDWKTVLHGLIRRGLRRVMIVVHDDLSGLLPVTQNLFPETGVPAVQAQRDAGGWFSAVETIGSRYH